MREPTRNESPNDASPPGLRRKRRRRRLAAIAAVPPVVCGFVVLGISSCISVPDPGSIPIADRLAAFPRDGHPLFGAVEIRFDGRQVPYIDAADERDVPYALGLVHAHLRLGQLEFLRRVARARLSEMAGPFASDIDHALRILDIDKAVPEIAASLPDDTRLWLERFVEGVNAVRDRAPLPPDFGILGFDREERWTIEDSLAVGRLASADINWAFWAGELGRDGDPGYAALRERLAEYQGAGTASFGPETPTPLDVLLRHVKSGSNSFVVAGSRTKSGGAIIASDPHLGLIQPNLWILGGYRTPERAVVGMMLPGLPVIALGRNDDIAWGGTNMMGLSSTLYDASSLDESAFATREERIRVRWWFDDTIEIRDTPLGPLISDAPFFEDLDAPPLAIRWRGHEPSDEVTAFLRVNRARSWEEFRAAFATYAVSGQNFLYADRDGRIGQLLAIEWDPAAGRAALAGLGDPEDPTHLWGSPLGAADLPAAVDPPEGFLVSCNNVPVKLDPPVTVVGNANDRVERLQELLGARDDWDLAGVAPVQTDTLSAASLRAARAAAAALGADAEIAATRWYGALRDWDGRYDVDSTGAFAYQALLPGIIEGVYEERYGETGAGYLESFRGLHEFVAEDIAAGTITADDLRAAAGPAREAFGEGEGRTWGEVHRVRVAHVVGQAPWIGRRFRFGEHPSPGSTSTVFKSAHSVSRDEHRVTFGSQSRHLSDLADPDANWFVLFGGQDGWLGSENFGDQLPLWRAEEHERYVQLPLRRETVERLFPHRVVLER